MTDNQKTKKLLKSVDELVKQLKKSKAPILKVVETTTIKARYAPLPIIDLSARYLVEILEPVHLIPMEMSVFAYQDYEVSKAAGRNPLNILKNNILRDWHKNFKDAPQKTIDQLPNWIKKVNKVKLIECDLLVPKK